MKIFIASDHAAFEAKQGLRDRLHSQGHQVEDLGADSPERSHYPHYAEKLSRSLQQEQDAVGILLCGSGIGMSMAANRYQGVRAAVCRGQEEAGMSRRHNNANVLCLASRFNTEEEMAAITDTWLETDFEGGRHAERVAMFDNLGI